jgi:hypothetical protein
VHRKAGNQVVVVARANRIGNHGRREEAHQARDRSARSPRRARTR